MTSKIKFLTQRGGTLYFRRRVPTDLQAYAGCHEWKIALGTVGLDEQMVAIEMRAFTGATDNALQLCRRGQRVDRDLLVQTRKALFPPQDTSSDLSWEDVEKAFCKSKSVDQIAKAEAMAIDQFRQFAPKKTLLQATRKDARAWRDWLSETRSQQPQTVRRRLNSMGAIFARVCEAQDLDLANPFHGLKVGGSGNAYRLPFHAGHFELIDQWLKNGRAEESTRILIRLLRGTGARPLEIGGLMREDVYLGGDGSHISIRPNRIRRLKTLGSTRIIPLCGDAREAAEALLRLTSGPSLFAPTCQNTTSLSARLNKALRSAGIPKSRRLTAYSFRHSFEEALRAADVPFEVQQALMGHAPSSMTDRYGAKRISRSRLQEAVLVAQERLGGADSTNYDEVEMACRTGPN